MFKSGIFVMLITLVSRVLGLARSVVVAYYFGASAGTDAFFSAFKISNFFRQLLGEGALGTSFIPLYNEKVGKEGEEEGKKFIFSILNIVFIFSVIVSVGMIIFSDEIIAVIVNGFSDETKIIASDLLKIMSCYFIFISLAGMIGAILNNFKCFVVPASTSIFFNLAILGGAVFFGKTYGIKAMAYGVLFGGFLQLVIVLPQFFKRTGIYRLKIDFKDIYIKRIFYLMLPMLVGIVARQFNTIVDQFFASYLEAGGVSALENATRIYNLPIGVFGISISTVIYPALSKKIVKKDFGAVEEDIKKGLNILLFLVVPSTIVLTVYATDVVRLIFEYGKFSKRAVEITSDSLLYYSLGLYFYTAIHLMTRAFYGMKNSRDPVKFSILSIGINILLNMLFIKTLQYKGLALSTSIAAMVNFSLLLYTFRKKYINMNLNHVGIFFLKVLGSSFAAVLASFYIKNIILKLIVFSAVYMALWGYTLYKKKIRGVLMGITNYKVYTPYEYGKFIVKLALKNYFKNDYSLEKLNNLRAVDLSCGTGNLIVILLEKLLIVSKKITGEYFFNPEWIRGYDIDEKAFCEYVKNCKKVLKKYNLSGKIEGFIQNSLTDDSHERKYNIVIGNPPYIGEKNHQYLFAEIKNTEFGKKYYEAKMDYFYFFIEKGIDILENNGILVYVTTNYWLKADGAAILRKKLRNEGHFTHIVDYNISIFKDAPGQHNMIFSWRKNQEISEKEKIENENFIADTEKEENKFSVKNKNLYDEKGNIILIDDKSRIFNKKLKEKSNCKLDDIVNINQGIVSGCDKAFITKTYNEKFGEYLKPFYKNKDVFKYSCKKENDFWIYYIPRGRKVSEELKEIFFPYKDILEKRREVLKGTHKWYELSWGRNENIMSGEKILARQRCKTNYFAYHKGEFFGSADIYYLTLKNSSFNIFYILGYLNSEIFYEWYKNNGKSKGYNLEFYTTPLKEVPVYYPEDKKETEYIEALVKKQIEKYSDDIQNEINEYFIKKFEINQAIN